MREKTELKGSDYNIITTLKTRRKSFSLQTMFISTGPENLTLCAISDSSILLVWTASSVTPTLNNPFYTIDKNGPQPCPYYDKSRKQTYCKINDLEVYTEYEFSLMPCDQTLIDNRTRCTSPSKATKKTRPQRMFLLGLNRVSSDLSRSYSISVSRLSSGESRLSSICSCQNRLSNISYD